MPISRSILPPSHLHHPEGGQGELVSMPLANGFTHISLNNKMAPFDN